MHQIMSLLSKVPYHKVLVQNYTIYPIHNILMLFYSNHNPINCCICCIYCNGNKSLCTISYSLILSQTIFPAKTSAKKIRVRVCELPDELDDPLVEYKCGEKLRLWLLRWDRRPTSWRHVQIKNWGSTQKPHTLANKTKRSPKEYQMKKVFCPANWTIACKIEVNNTDEVKGPRRCLEGGWIGVSLKITDQNEAD
jgi:hypothetical protein